MGSSKQPALTDPKDYYDAFSKSYERLRHKGYHAFIDDLQAEIIAPFVRGKKVLEVGCGTGLILERIVGETREAMGLDLSPGMLEPARARGLTVVEGSATELPFEDESFDVTYSFKVLSHIPDLQTALAEMARVTRPGGHVFIELYNKHSIRYLARLVRGGRTIAQGFEENRVFFRFYTIPEMVRHLPDSLCLERRYGVRIFTLLPGMIAWPLLGPVLRWLERRAARGFLARWGGFLLLHCRKR